MQNKDFMEIEAQGYEKGLNPMMGEFNRKFCFAPVPHGSKRSHQFVKQIHKVLADIQYVYFDEVKLDITLYLDEQKRMETPELADLDNYAKLICDSLKGPNGLLIDDSQVKSLLVYWIDTPESPYFEIRIKGHPDDFITKPLALYEMSNGLFYPISPNSWTKDGIKKKTEAQVDLLLAALYEMIQTSRDFRQRLRQGGSGPLEAFRTSRYLSPALTGFPKSRVIDSGFSLYSFSEWKSKIDIKKAIETIDKVVAKRT